MEWLTIALQGGPWIFIAVAFTRGLLVSRSQAERVALMERMRGDEWKAIAERYGEVLDIQRDSVHTALEGLRTYETLLRSIDDEARQRRLATDAQTRSAWDGRIS